MNLPFFNDEPGQGERTVLHQPSLPLPRGGAVNRVRLLPEAKPDADISDGIDGRRAKIWELGETLHCSIVGTCLSTAELRQVLTRAKVIGVEKASEHELHILGVMAASRRDVAGRFLQKALDRRHRGTLNQFARAADAAALRAMWDDAARKGDIPGAYWAVLTHPATTNDVVKHVFGEVHMLSHLVGAANRADIRRLRQLEDDNAALQAKLTRQQRHLQDAFAVRDEAVRRLNAVASVQPAPDTRTEGQAAAATQALIGDLNRRLLAQDTHIQKLQGRLDTAASSQKQAVEMQRRAQAECAAMAEELDLANARLAAAVAPGGASEDSLRLSGTTLLYVGGRAHQVPGLRALVERAGGEFLHHDGGVDDNATLLPGLVSRAALVLFPVDCISHAAMSTVKRLCGQSGKRFVPLRTASLTCLLAALAAAQ